MTIVKPRKGVIDALRGYFIIWIGLYNTFAVFNAIHPNLALSSILLFINDKGWFCMSAIFGYGFGMMIKNRNLPAGYFQKRLILLFCIGIFNNLFYYGDILKEYAIIGLILFYTKNFSTKHPLFFLGIILFFTVIALYFIPFDMKNAGEIKSYFGGKNIFLANLNYCFNLNIHSLYFGICYHVEMLLLTSIGYLIAFNQLESVIVFYRKWLSCSALIMMIGSLILIFFVLEKSNPLIKITFFVYIFSFSVWFVLGFYGIIKKVQKLKQLFVAFGRRSLTIYLLQNGLIFNIWIWDNSVVGNLFWVYCFGQIMILLVSGLLTKKGMGIVEYYWRFWSSRKIEVHQKVWGK